MLAACQKSVPKAGQGFVICTGNEGDLDALIANLVAVKNADGSYSLLQRSHLYLSFELVVCVRTELNTFHLEGKHGDKQNNLVTKLKVLLWKMHLL